MKAAGFVLLGVVLGFVLGGIGPRREVVRLERDVARLERELDLGGGGGGGALRSPVVGLSEVLRAPSRRDDDAEGEGDRRVANGDGAGTEEGTGDEAAAIGPDGGVRPIGFGRRWRERGPSEALSQFMEAAAIQRVRRMQTRAALIEQAELDDAEVAAVDAAVERMNEDLQAYGEELLYLAMSEEPPTARDLLGVTHEVTGIMSRAQDELGRILGPERSAEVERSAGEVWNYVDLDRLEPAAREAARRTRRR